MSKANEEIWGMTIGAGLVVLGILLIFGLCVHYGKPKMHATPLVVSKPAVVAVTNVVAKPEKKETKEETKSVKTIGRNNPDGSVTFKVSLSNLTFKGLTEKSNK